MGQPAALVVKSAGDHLVSDVMAISAEEGDVEWLVIRPMMPLESPSTSTPSALRWSDDHPELLRKRGGIAC